MTRVIDVDALKEKIGRKNRRPNGMIQKEWQYTAKCDICGAMDMMSFVSQTKFIHELRKRYGWRVFRNSDGRLMSFCPECRERRKKERGVVL